jgi:beta-lactamase regulating signal transducer with metallopeptidase domain
MNLATLLILNQWTALLLVGAIALDHVLARRIRAAWRVALYAPLVVRVLVPLGCAFPWVRGPRTLLLFAPTPMSLPALAVPSSSLIGLPAIAIALYLAIALTLAYAILQRRAAAQRIVRDARPMTPNVARLPPCPVVEHPSAGPMVVGLVSPRIVIPSELRHGGGNALATVLGHECAHVMRRDTWLIAAMQLVLVLFWPVLPLWAAAWRVRQLVEMACDERALDAATTNERRLYGHALLDLAELRALTPMSAELHFGSTLRARIQALAWTRRWPVPIQIAFVVGVAAAFAACSSVGPEPIGAEPMGGAKDRYGYAFESDPAKSVAAVPAPAPPPSQAVGRMPPETIQAVVRSHFHVFKACYDAGLARDPKLEGTVTVGYMFGDDGVTRDVADHGSTLPDKDVVGCVVAEFRKATYPTGAGGDVSVVYPLQFAP